MAFQTYYVDSVEGNDATSGLNPLEAFKSLEAINKLTFTPGDRILFKSGQCFEGGLTLKGSGSQSAPIQVNSYTYDQDEVHIGVGEKPVIQGNGTVLYALHLHNGSFWEIKNLEITNLGSEPLKGRTGVLITADENFTNFEEGIVEHIHVSNLFVHDVNGHPEIKDHDNGGIFFCILSTDVEKPLVFKDILIEGCHVKNVQRTGISFGSSAWCSQVVGDNLSLWTSEDIQPYLHQNVVIRNNYVESVGGDAIVPMYSYQPLVIHNTSQEASKSTKDQPDLMYNAGIWPWQCYEALFQYNEAFRTYLNGDGQAYDCDWSYGTVYRDNYSHDNEGGFMLVCKENAIGSSIENNISYNDRRCLFMTSNVHPAHVSGNIFYIAEHLDTQVFSEHTGPVVAEGNTFYKEGNPISTDWHEEGNRYDQNSYTGFINLPEAKNTDLLIQLEPVHELMKLQNELPDPQDALALERGYQAENQRRRQTLAEGGIIYGCQTYTKAQYVAYVKSNREVLDMPFSK